MPELKAGAALTFHICSMRANHPDEAFNTLNKYGYYHDLGNGNRPDKLPLMAVIGFDQGEFLPFMAVH